MPTEQEIIEVVEMSARDAARRHRLHWRELLGDAYIKAITCSSPGAALYTAARRGILDGYRIENGRKTRKYLLHFEQYPTLPFGDFAEEIPDHRDSPSLQQRLQDVWVETRQQRTSWGWKVRVWVYLWAVESWTQREIARVWGCTPPNITLAIAKFVHLKDKKLALWQN